MFSMFDLLEPPAARPVDAEAHEVELRGGAGTGGDLHRDPFLLSQIAVNVVEVETLGPRVQFEEATRAQPSQSLNAHRPTADDRCRVETIVIPCRSAGAMPLPHYGA
jgi:hypothetical protein